MPSEMDSDGRSGRQDAGLKARRQDRTPKGASLHDPGEASRNQTRKFGALYLMIPKSFKGR